MVTKHCGLSIATISTVQLHDNQQAEAVRRGSHFHHFDFHPFFFSALPRFCPPRLAASIISESSLVILSNIGRNDQVQFLQRLLGADSARSSTRTRCSRDFQGLRTPFRSGISASPSLLFIEASKTTTIHSLTPRMLPPVDQWTIGPSCA